MDVPVAPTRTGTPRPHAQRDRQVPSPAAALLGVMLAGSLVAAVLEPVSVAIVGLGTVALLLASVGSDGVRVSLRALVRERSSTAALELAEAVFRLGGFFALGLGLAGTLVSLVAGGLLGGPAVEASVSLAVQLDVYAVALCLAWFGCAAIVEGRQEG